MHVTAASTAMLQESRLPVKLLADPGGALLNKLHLGSHIAQFTACLRRKRSTIT